MSHQTSDAFFVFSVLSRTRTGLLLVSLASLILSAGLMSLWTAAALFTNVIGITENYSPIHIMAHSIGQVGFLIITAAIVMVVVNTLLGTKNSTVSQV